jgi:hypothetical protein
MPDPPRWVVEGTGPFRMELARPVDHVPLVVELSDAGPQEHAPDMDVERDMGIRGTVAPAGCEEGG